MSDALLASTAIETLTVRASYLSGWPDCPRRSAARMFWPIVRDMGFKLRRLSSSVGAAVGQGVHAAARTMLDQKARTGVLSSVAESNDVAIQVLREKIREGVIYDRETQSLNEGEQQTLRMARAYRFYVAEKVKPIIVEERFEARVPWTRNPLILSGQPDLVAEEPDAVDDLKGGKMRGNHRPQIGSYSLIVRSNNRARIKQVRETWLPRTSLRHPQREPEVYIHDLVGSEQAAVAVLRHVDACLTTFLEGDAQRHVLPGDPWAFPANPQSKLCSDKFCPAWGTEFCREHDKGVRNDVEF